MLSEKEIMNNALELVEEEFGIVFEKVNSREYAIAETNEAQDYGVFLTLLIAFEADFYVQHGTLHIEEDELMKLLREL